jgi:DNA-binding transcriptional regulator YiaG
VIPQTPREHLQTMQMREAAMPAPKQLNPELSPLHYFGAEFRRVREAAKMSQGTFAATVPCDVSTVSRIEGGELGPNDAFVVAMLGAFPELAWLGRFYEASRKWSNGPVPPWFEDYLRAETQAHTLRIWQPLIVPGPFQSSDYARELFKVEQPDLTNERLDEQVAARLERQNIFDKSEPPNTWVVLDEAVLHRCIGSAKVMHDQLLQMADMSLRSYVSLQVVPASSAVHPGLAGSFQIASVDGKPDLMLIEAVVEDQTTERGSFVRKVTVAFDRLRGFALSCAGSRDLILKVAEDKWNTLLKS